MSYSASLSLGSGHYQHHIDLVRDPKSVSSPKLCFPRDEHLLQTTTARVGTASSSCPLSPMPIPVEFPHLETPLGAPIPVVSGQYAQIPGLDSFRRAISHCRRKVDRISKLLPLECAQASCFARARSWLHPVPSIFALPLSREHMKPPSVLLGLVVSDKGGQRCNTVGCSVGTTKEINGSFPTVSRKSMDARAPSLTRRMPTNCRFPMARSANRGVRISSGPLLVSLLHITTRWLRPPLTSLQRRSEDV